MLPKLGDMPSVEKITEGSKRLFKAPGPYFPSDRKIEVPSGFEWVIGLMDTFLDRLKRTVFKASAPYYQYPPFEHIDIDAQAMVTIVAAATTTILTVTVPQHQTAVIRLYGQDIEATVPPTLATAWNDIKWTFKRGKFALQYYDGFIGQRGSMINPRSTAITLQGPETFTISAENIGAVSYDVTASIIGHQYSILSTPLPKEDIL